MSFITKFVYKDYLKKLASTINKNDFGAFKEFYVKNNKFITGGMGIPDDFTLKVVMWKTACNLKGVFPKVKEEAEKQLNNIGYSSSVRKFDT